MAVVAGRTATVSTRGTRGRTSMARAQPGSRPTAAAETTANGGRITNGTDGASRKRTVSFA
jgi:hypothetical protein